MTEIDFGQIAGNGTGMGGGSDSKFDPAAIANGLLEALQGKGSTYVTPDDEVSTHRGKNIIIPEGMPLERAAKALERKAQEENEVHSFHHATKYRPADGAYAAAAVMKRMFGLVLGEGLPSFFGKQPPELMPVEVNPGKVVEVPWGLVSIPSLEGVEFYLHACTHDNPKYGRVFAVSANGAKKHKEILNKFFAELDKELEEHSIYRGKALMGADELSFLPGLDNFPAHQIVFSNDVQATVDAAINGLVEHTAATVAAGLPTKRAVLLYGPYGTGKTSLGMITAQRATRAGWTYIAAAAGKRNELKKALETAQLYQPCVVFVEDIEKYTPEASDKDGISLILDLFDGVAVKGSKLLVVMTTNNIDQVPAGMLRPGRIDYAVEISGLDRDGTERLIKAVVNPDQLSTRVDYDAVWEEMKVGWQPAWIKAVADRAKSFALARTGDLSFVLETEDFVFAARNLKPQLGLMDSALEGYERPTIETALGGLVRDEVREAVNGARIIDQSDGEYMYDIKVGGA